MARRSDAPTSRVRYAQYYSVALRIFSPFSPGSLSGFIGWIQAVRLHVTMSAKIRMLASCSRCSMERTATLNQLGVEKISSMGRTRRAWRRNSVSSARRRWARSRVCTSAISGTEIENLGTFGTQIIRSVGHQGSWATPGMDAGEKIAT